MSNGSNVSVTNENREEFVQLYLDWLLNSSIDERFRAFYLGKYEKQLPLLLNELFLRNQNVQINEYLGTILKIIYQVFISVYHLYFESNSVELILSK